MLCCSSNTIFKRAPLAKLKPKFQRCVCPRLQESLYTIWEQATVCFKHIYREKSVAAASVCYRGTHCHTLALWSTTTKKRWHNSSSTNNSNTLAMHKRRMDELSSPSTRQQPYYLRLLFNLRVPSLASSASVCQINIYIYIQVPLIFCFFFPWNGMLTNEKESKQAHPLAKNASKSCINNIA